MKEYNIKVNGNDYVVSIEEENGTISDVLVNGTHYNIELAEGLSSVKAKPQVVATPASHPVQPSSVVVGQPKQATSAGGAGAPIKSPLPGAILDVKVSVGDTIAVGQCVVVLEAMKMENNVSADRGGVVTSVKVSKGDTVLEGDVLITVE